MASYSSGFGRDRDAHFDRWSSNSSDSGSERSSRSSSRHGRRSRREISPMSGLDTRFADLMRDHHDMTRGMPSMFECMTSMLGGQSTSSAFSGFPGMLRGRQRSRTSSFDSDRDTVRPDSTYSGFPGMPRMAGRAFDTERSESFNMRRTDRSSSGSHRRHRSPSPPTSSYSRGYRTTERAPQSAWAPGANRSHNPQGYSSSSYSSYATRPASPPRRYRSPSPPPRRQRQRSPSPVDRSHGRSRRRSPSPSASRHEPSSRADSARGYRTSERRPEGASSRTAGSSSYDRSRSRTEQPSRDQYNPGYSTSGSYSHGTSQGTSNNAYNARPMPSHSNSSSRPQHNGHQRARSPSPQTKAHAHDNTSRTRSPSTATPKPVRSRADLKALFDSYNTTWESLSRTDKSYPLPAPSRDLHRLDFAGGSSSNTGNWSAEQIFVANVQLIFIAGFSLSGSLNRNSDGLDVKIDDARRHGSEIQALGKWLRRKEQPRWHPDRMNARTGKIGVLDEGISRKRDVVAMRSTGQALLAVVGK